MDSPEELPTVLSLCTGYGGIERGLELAGFEHRVVAHVEIEAFACCNLAAKMEAGELDAAPIWSNLKTLPVDCFRDRVYLLTGGYPCPPFSAAGKRKGKDDPRHLWPHIHDIIRAVRPVQCFFENVEGHISLGLREVIEDLEGLGYKTTFGIFSASEVGAPHQRKRIFILANSNGAGFKTLRDESGTKRQKSAVSESRELGDSQNNRLSGGAEDSQREGSEDICERSNQDLRSKSQRSGQALAYTKREGLQGSSECRSDTREAKEGTEGAYGNFRRLLSLPRNLWPSRPSEDQHSWEASRTLKPSLGRTTDGCPDRVDRLRLLGNGVCPQTSAKAWIVLNEQIEEEE